MSAPRPVNVIRHELSTARAYSERSSQRASTHPLVVAMREANAREIDDLERELAAATSGALELRFAGPTFEDHRISVPLLSRVLGAVQSSFRAAYRSVAPQQPAGKRATLTLAGTAPGSFRLHLATAPMQLDLLAPPIADQAMSGIVDLLASAGRGTATELAPAWAERTDEAYVRSMIGLAAALAGSRANMTLRWAPASGGERLIDLTSEQARELAMALAGQTGREIITVTGHLEMGQDQPPRVKISTPDHTYLAVVPTTELLDQVKDLLFEEVRATLAIDMRTSASTGKPDTEVELLDITEAD